MGTHQHTPVPAHRKQTNEVLDFGGSGSYGSPISGLCAGAAAAAWPNVREKAFSSTWCSGKGPYMPAAKTGQMQVQPQSPVHLSPRHSPTSSMSWAPNKNCSVLASSSGSMPELWHGQHTSHYSASGLQYTSHRLDAADSLPPRDQRFRASQPNVSQQQQQASSLSSSQQCQTHTPWQQHPSNQPHSERHSDQQQHSEEPSRCAGLQLVQQQATAAPLDVLLAPLLPSADESKVLERLSQLRQALEEQHRLAAGWEHQAVRLQLALSEGQQENLTMRGQLIAQQHNISLLGGNLQGRLSMVQGAVLAQLQAQLAEKDSVIAGGQQKLSAIQLDLEKLHCNFASKLVAEQTERERLSAEAAQARLLCQARSRQVTELQEEIQQLRQNASKQQEIASVGAVLQQQQLEQLHQKVQELEHELAAAKQAAADAQRQVSAVEGGRLGLRQQVQELQAALAEKQLQTEWLEGKIADLESSDLNSQLKRHSSEVARLRSAAAAERQTLEQQLTKMQEAYADLQQQNEQQQQQLAEQQEAAEQQIVELQQQLEAGESQLQQLKLELDAARVNGVSPREDSQQQQRAQIAAAMASDSDDDANGTVNRSTAQQAQSLVTADESQTRPGTPASAAVEYALRAQLGIANAEVARLRHELDVAKAAQSEERQLTGAEIIRLQQELSEAAASASSTADATAAAAEETEVASQPHPLEAADDSSGNSWHSVHDNPAYEQQQSLVSCKRKQRRQFVVQDVSEIKCQYEARLQDQAETISSLQQQLKQQQQLMATLRKPERRVHDSAASRSSWVDILATDEDGRHNPAAARHLTTAATVNAAVQTDGCSPTESAGSTAAVAAADDGVDITSPRHTIKPEQQQQQQHGDVLCEGAAGYALLSAARQEIQRLQELNRQLLQTHAEEMKSSVSFEAARRALSEAKAHAKTKAAAVLQTSNKAWQDKMNAMKQEKQHLMIQVQELQQQVEHLQQQAVIADRAQADVAVLQQQLHTAQDEVQQLQRQMRDLMDSHAQDLEQLRIELESEAAAAFLDAGAAAARASSERQQQVRDASVQVALQVTPLLLEVSVQTEQLPGSPQQQQQQETLVSDCSSLSLSAGQDMQQHDQLVAELPQQQQYGVSEQQHTEAVVRDGLEIQQPHQQQQQQQQAATAVAERPGTPQPAPATPAAAVPAAAADTAAADGSSDAAASASLAAAVPSALPPAAAAGSAAAVTPPAAGIAAAGNAPPVLQHWHAADAADDDMCRMSSASDTPASRSSRLHGIRPHSSRAVPPPAAAAGSSSSEYGDCSSGSAYCGMNDGSRCGEATRPSSAGTVQLPELQNSTSPVPAVRVTSGLIQAQQKGESSLLDQPLLQQQQQDAAAARLSNWHAELLQQQVQLDKLRMRLSQHQQHKHSPVLRQQQQQQVLRPGGSSTSLLGHQRLTAVNNSGRGVDTQTAAAAAAAGSSGPGSAGYIPQLRAESPVLEPVAGGNSPLTWTQRRQQRQQQQQQQRDQLPTAGQWTTTSPSVYSGHPYAAASLTSSSSGGYPGTAIATPPPAAAAASGVVASGLGHGHHSRQYSEPDVRYNSTDTWHTTNRTSAGTSAVGSYEVHRTFTNSLYQEREYRPTAAAAAAGSSSFLSLGLARSAAAAAACSATNPLDALGSMTVTSDSTLVNDFTSTTVTGQPAQQQKVMGGRGFDGGTNSSGHVSTPASAHGGFDQLHVDVMGALSLSRYHRERSKQQEARAKQHALNAQDALDRAAAVRSSRLAGGTAAAGSPGTAAVHLGGRSAA